MPEQKDRPTLPRWLLNDVAATFVIALALGTLCFAFDWGGYRSKPEPWGDPRPLAEVWWHLPLFIAACWAGVEVFRRWPLD